MAKQVRFLCLILIGCFSILSSAQAMLKLDLTRSVGEIFKSVTEQVGNTVDSAQKQLEHLKTYQKMFDGIKEGVAKIDELKTEVNKGVSAVKDVKNAVGDVTDAVNSAADTVENAKNMASAQELNSLGTELASAKRQFEVKRDELEEEYTREVKSYQDNIKKCEELIEQERSPDNTNPDKGAISYCNRQIEENKAQIEEIDKKYKKQIEDLAKDFEANSKEITDKINRLKKQALGMNFDDPFSVMNSGAVGNLFSGDAGAAMNEVIANNFYKKDEEDSVEGNKRLMAYRRGKFLDDAAEVYYQAVQQMSEDDTNIEYTSSLQSEGQGVETTPASIMIDIPVKIENMKKLLKFARLLTAEMKMATSKDMINMPKKLNNYDKDVTNFNIDDYAYSDSKKGLLKKLETLKQQAADLRAKEAAAKVGSTTSETVSAVNIASTTKNKFAGIFRAIKTILYIISGFGLVGIAFQAIRGRLRWGWFAALAAGLAILAATGAFVEYATGDNHVSGYFGDTATNAAGY